MREVAEAVAAACSGVEGLQAAIVFGSVLERAQPGDLDVALLWEERLDPVECWNRGNRIATEIERRLGLNVDLKDLRRLPLVLQHRVLRDGRAAYVADRRELVRFNSEIVPRALDFLPFYRRALRAGAKRLAGERR